MTKEQRLREIQKEIDATCELRRETDAHMRELLTQLHNEFPEEFRTMQERLARDD